MTTTLSYLAYSQRKLRDLQESIRAQVARARKEGESWAAIGAALGISPQAAHKRFSERPADIEEVPLSDPLFDVLFETKQQ